MTWIHPIPLAHRGVVIAMLALLAGCAPQAPMMMRSLQEPVTHGLRPDRLLYSRSPDGMYDILLVEEPADTRRSPRAALQPTEGAPLRQIVHMRVFWRPHRGTEADHPAAANSAINWYIMGVGTAYQQDLLLYEGSGFTSVHPAGRGISVRVRDAYLRANVQRGELTDPLGDVQLSGTFEAIRDDNRVEQFLNEIRALGTAQPAADASAGDTLDRPLANDMESGR